MGGLVIVLIGVVVLYYIIDWISPKEDEVNKELDKKFEEEMKKYD